MNRILTDCVYRKAKKALRQGCRRIVFLTSAGDSNPTRMILASILPVGSTCMNTGVWVTPDGTSIEVHGFPETPPNYDSPVALYPCYGGAALTPEEIEHVRKWRTTVPTMAS